MTKMHNFFKNSDQTKTRKTGRPTYYFWTKSTIKRV